MSEFREDLLATPINKKRVIKIILTAVLLTAAFAFSTVFFNLLWDNQRPPPSDQLSEAEDEDVILILPPFPYNLSDFQDMFSDQNLTLDQLSDLLDALQEMFDGDIDDLDLSNYSQALAGLMGSEVEVFRLYDYDDFNEMQTKLWKYESFDEYTGDGWHSSAAKQIFDFYSYMNYFISHSDKDLLSLKMLLTPSVGMNSMVIPSLFPNPHIMEGSILPEPNYTTGPPSLYKDDFNCTTLDIEFDPSTQGNVSLKYELFGLDLPTGTEIDAMAVEPVYTDPVIQNKYLQLKGDTLDVYINNNDDFAYYVNELNKTITSSDNSFIVADKIRNYLQYNFTKITDPNQYNPAPQGYDQVEWFCEQGIGYWADFTSAFCAFARVFGVPSRFVNGFNSFAIQEMFDTTELKNTFAIKYKHMYTWSEIYVPTDTVGNGMWIQMDVYYDNYGGNPPSLANYSLTLNTNFTSGYRGNMANLTATLTLDGNPVDGRPINFFDLTSTQSLGQISTNINGEASLLINIDDTQVVGPHYIFAQFNPNVNDTTLYTIYGDIEVNLQIINPQEVNISIDTMTNIQGYVYDPIANLNVGGATLEVILLQKGTNNRVGAPPFDMTYFNADPYGYFDIYINVDPSVSVGQYELRVDTNGSWYFFPYANGFVNDSSNRMDFNVSKGILKYVWFYINDVPSFIPDSPVVDRYTDLILKAKVVNETNYPIPNQNVQFFDYWSGIQIGANTTDVNGVARYKFTVNNLMATGPNLLYAKIGIEENHSYFILNEEPIINIFSGPSPREINRTAIGASNTFFNIEGELLDHTTGRPIRNSMVSLKLLRGGLDYSPYLIPTDTIWTDSNGYFNVWFEVASNTPTGNYTLRLDFNGTISRMGHPIYPAFFNLPYINTSSTFANELMVTTPTTLTFNFWIDDTPSDDYNQPVIYRNGYVNLSVYLEWGGIPVGDGEWVDFYDVTQDILIGSAQTINGYTSLMYYTDFSTVAGPHQVYARWGSNYNYSYFLYNANISVNLESGPTPNVVARSGAINRNFNLHGYVNDSTNGSPIKYTRIFVYMYDQSLIDYTGYLSLESGFLRLDESGEFDLTYSVISSTPEKKYTIIVTFDGWFMYSWPFILNNEYDFYLGGFSNFTSYDYGSLDLQVYDPENLTIYLAVEGNPTLPFFNNLNPPETYKFDETIHVQVQLDHPEEFGSRTVYIYDDYTNSLLDSYTFSSGSTGFVQFNLSTNDLHAGLLRFRVNYHTFSGFNTTYVVINETIGITMNVDRNVVQRNFHQFNVDGVLQQNGTHLDGLMIGLILWDFGIGDVSGYLNLNGPQFRTVYGGNYLYDNNGIFISCPQGDYYLDIVFTGNINDVGISLTNYMETVSRSIQINITAGTNINGNYDTKVVKDQFYEGDDLYVYGFLNWDNGTAMAGMEVNITIRDSIGNVLATATGSTDIAGFFNITLVVGSWPDNAEVWVTFYPEANFSTPYYYFVEFFEIQLYREP
ncbi:MAG: transglutaminase domain-containing protein [Candidatus Lokiarchaeota archaeon]|nr:transglutaminase domain-containing protein [Candidatus Lokiarchaeota archaeon]